MSNREEQANEHEMAVHQWPSPQEMSQALEHSRNVNSGTGNFPSWTTYSLAASQLLHDVNEKSHFETLTEAKSLRANLRIMASISGHNEPAASALTTMHRLDWTTIKQETMARQAVVGRHFGDDKKDKEDAGEQTERQADDITNGSDEYTHLHLYAHAHRDMATAPLNDASGNGGMQYSSVDTPGEHSSNHQMSPWLQHLSMLSSGSLFDVHHPYISTQALLAPTDLRVTAKEHTSEQVEHYRARGRKLDSGNRSAHCHSVSRSAALGKRSSRSGRGHGPLSKEQQRRNACVRERTRMRDMNLAFDTLRDRLPYIRQHGKRISKIEALRLTIKYIKQLKEILHDANNNLYINEHN